MIEQQNKLVTESIVSSNPLLQLIERMKPLHVLLNQNSYVKDTTRRLKRIIDDASSQTMILVMGKERVGKTTFINGLLGREVLSASSEHPTAANTFIRYGEEECVKAIFLDGMVATFDLGKVELLTISDAFCAQIIREHLDYIEVFIKHDLLKNVTIVDSVALEVAADHSAYFSELLVDRMDDIFWVIRSGSIATEAELALLDKYNERGMKPHFIINAIDDTENVAAFMQSESERYGGKIASMTAVSATQALEAAKTNNAQLFIDSKYGELHKLLEELTNNHTKKTQHVFERFVDWLELFRKEIEQIPQREPYLSAFESIEKYTGNKGFEYTRQQRDMALLTAYEQEYEHVCHVFKPVETLYQLLQTLANKLYLRDDKVEEFESVALQYHQAVREYRKLHVEYMQTYGLLDQQYRKLFGKGIERGDLVQINQNSITKAQKERLDQMQQKCGEQYRIIKYYEAHVVENLYSIQNHITELAQKRLQTIIHQVAELNSQRKREVKIANSYVNKLSEFSCIIEAQHFVRDAIKPYLLSGAIELTENQQVTIENTIDGMIAVQLSQKEIELPSEESDQDSLLHQEFETKYMLSPLSLTEVDVLSDLPDLPAPFMM
ncbi:dynamin family protein [Lysinibacillus sp. LZ02]|uniref:dynamin family protein n=1 Tax=Lysinibacillus sp. LZ02 TaxID=3420668 RepID=UPI003D366DF6